MPNTFDTPRTSSPRVLLIYQRTTDPFTRPDLAHTHGCLVTEAGNRGEASERKRGSKLYFAGVIHKPYSL